MSVLEMPLSSIMKTDIPLIKKDETVLNAVRIMQKTGTHFVCIVDGFNVLHGTLSSKDVLKAFEVPSIMGGTLKVSEEFFYEGLKKKAEELMTSPPIHLRDDATVSDAVRTFTNNQVNFIPIINKGDVVVGLVSLVEVFSLAKG